MSAKSSLLGKIILYTFFAILALFFIVISTQTIFAQSEEELKKELEKVEEEIQETQKTLGQQRAKSYTIESKVTELRTEINKAQSVINQKSQTISRIGSDIDIKQQTVVQLNEKLERSKDTLSELLRTTNQLDDVSLPEIILEYDNISDFFSVIDTLVVVQDSLDQLFDQIRELRGLTEEEKQDLEEKKKAEANAKAEVEREKNQVALKKSEQDTLLSLSRQSEQTYEQVLAEKQAKANAIRSALFRLRDSSNISFGEALDYANAASRATGVRAAFILAILKQESNIGQNVGTCNRPGDPESKKWYNIMPGPTDGSWRDDQTNYKKIVTALGRPIDGTPLSCPLGNGWGGAMGPSQFIPTTWLSYEAKIESALGVSQADPWNPEHAFTATGLYVKDLGAALGTYSAEKEAALRYYAGSNWSLPQNQFYGNQVMGHAAEFQTSIDFLKDID
jgi:peptidoglycan hydrolase CwlO-like protein